MTDTEPVKGSLKASWREQDGYEAIERYHQDNCRGIGMSGWVGLPITPECLYDILGAAWKTLDTRDPDHPQLGEHLAHIMSGFKYEKEAWEQQGRIIPLDYPDGLTTAPHMYALAGVCDKVRPPDPGNKKKAQRQRRRSKAPATSTTK